MKYFKRATYLILAIFSFISVKAYSMNTKPPVEKVHYEPSPSTPRCVGRYLIDVPEKFEELDQKKESYIGKLNGLGVQVQYPVSKQQFEQKIEYLESQFRDVKNKNYIPLDSKNLPYLKNVEHLTINGNPAIIFNHNESITTNDMMRVLEGYVWNKNASIRFDVKAIDVSDKRYEAESKEYGYYSTLPQKRQNMIEAMKLVEGWDNLHIPQEAGSCWSSVFVKGKPNLSENSAGAWFYKLKENDQHIGIILDFNTYVKEKNTMLERRDGNDTLLGVTLIRQGIVKLPNMPNAHAEEQLVKDAEGNLMFALLINEKSGSKATPYTGMTFYDKGRLKQEDAVVIWDGLLKTLRPRPGAF